MVRRRDAQSDPFSTGTSGRVVAGPSAARSPSGSSASAPYFTGTWSGWVRALVSALLVAHFFGLIVTLASNNSLQRSEWEDGVVVAMQPYLTSMGWYAELAPLALATGQSYDQSMRIEFKKSKSDRTWTSWKDSFSTSATGRWRRLSALAGALAYNEDEEGIGLIAHSLVTKAARDGVAIDRIRFVLPVAAETGGTESELETLYEASVVKLEPDELTLIPKIEETRSVPPVLDPVPSGGQP